MSEETEKEAILQAAFEYVEKYSRVHTMYVGWRPTKWSEVALVLYSELKKTPIKKDRRSSIEIRSAAADRMRARHTADPEYRKRLSASRWPKSETRDQQIKED